MAKLVLLALQVDGVALEEDRDKWNIDESDRRIRRISPIGELIQLRGIGGLHAARHAR
jgi:hypothetical protein